MFWHRYPAAFLVMSVSDNGAGDIGKKENYCAEVDKKLIFICYASGVIRKSCYEEEIINGEKDYEQRFYHAEAFPYGRDQKKGA